MILRTLISGSLISLIASADLTAVGLSGNLNGIQWSLDLYLPSPLQTHVSRALPLLRAFSSMMFLLSFHVQIPKGFYPSYPAISTIVLAINDKNMLLGKHLPTISPFGIDGNYNTRILFYPFDINVKEETCSP
jgi:hypothetical protein